MSQNGKGDKPRPKGVDYNTWSNNYDRIFKKGKYEQIKQKPKRQDDFWCLWRISRIYRYKCCTNSFRICFWCNIYWQHFILVIFSIRNTFAKGVGK